MGLSPTPIHAASTDEAAPTAPGARIQALDVVRGVAVLGILLVNIHYFWGLPLEQVLAGEPVAHRGRLDALIEVATGTLISGTFLGLFSLLFGVGVAMQLSRPRRGRFGSTRMVAAQRMFWLGLIGLGHTQLVGTDVLLIYGVVGLLIVLLAGPTLPPARGWVNALGAAGVAIFLGGLVVANGIDPALMEAIFNEPRPQAAQEILEDGSYPAHQQIRAMEAFAYHGRYFFLTIIGWNLVGLWLGCSGLLQRLKGPAKPLLVAGTGCLIVGLALRLGMGLVGSEAGPLAGIDGVGGAMSHLGSIALVLAAGALSAGVAIWSDRRGRPLTVLARVGRMALTAYLLQTFLVIGLFLLPGHGEWLDARTALVAVAAIWVILIAFAYWWMGRFRFGPMEWAWRSLTYLRLQPFRRKSS